MKNYYDEEFSQEEEYEEEKKYSCLGAYLNEFMISAAIHSLILLLLCIIPVDNQQQVKRTIIINQIENKEEKDDKKEIENIKIEQTDVKVNEVEETTETTEVETEIEVEDTNNISEMEDESEEAIVAGTGDLADAPPAIVGVGGGSSGGSGLPYGYKSRSKAGKRKAMAKYGADKGTQDAVDAALRWLYHHQETDGSWKCLEGTHKGLFVGTSMALLAFMGAGHTEQFGKYKNTVKKGLLYMNNNLEKRANGGKIIWIGNGYEVGMILQALSEAAIMGSSSRTRNNADELAEDIISAYNGKGYRYSRNAGNDDQSVSGWIALGLKGAKAAQLESMKTKKAEEVLKEYKDWVFDTVGDNDKGMGGYIGKGGSRAMTYINIFQRQFLGAPRNDPFFDKAAQNLTTWVPLEWPNKQKYGSCYFIYYGTLASFQLQGAPWKTWNPVMKTVLIKEQCKGDPKQLGGSWNATDCHTGKAGGRTLTTALFALCLEVYYRYELMN